MALFDIFKKKKKQEAEAEAADQAAPELAEEQAAEDQAAEGDGEPPTSGVEAVADGAAAPADEPVVAEPDTDSEPPRPEAEAEAEPEPPAPETEPEPMPKTPKATRPPDEAEVVELTEEVSETELEAEPEGEPQEEAAPVESEEKPEDQKRGLFGRMFQRLAKTRDKIGGSIERITLGKKIDEEVLDELEEVLVTADLGVKTSLELIEGLRGKVRRKELDDTEALKKALKDGIVQVLTNTSAVPERGNDPHVIMVVGVNGVGKTTSVGKLANHFAGQGRKVLLAAADTFRAAAAEQLEIWAQRADCPLVRQQHGSDPSAVAYDAVDAALNRGRDLVLIDTAGRLHTKVNLMDELKKIHRVVGKKLPEAPHEVLLVLDATTGQNALQQAKLFHQTVPLTGIVLTKLDGTAKGGVVVAIAGEMGLPICYVGLGEGIDDLKPFDARDFAEAIF